MNSYKTFAQFYDRLTENAEYEVRADYVSDFFSTLGNGCNTVLDLACGTGTMAKQLADKGYNVTGIDLSDDMLAVASSKCINGLSLIKGDMTDFVLPQKYDYCLCSLDSINHLDNINAVKSAFDCVYNSLNDGGIFVFDVNTVYKHEFVLADNTFVFDEDDFFLSWDNEYLGENRVRIILDFFVFNGENYDRYTEEFIETAYDEEVIRSALTGFEIIGVYDELTNEPPKPDSERIYFVCKRK